MIYFLILPLFVLWLIFAVAIVLVTRMRPALRPRYPYVVRACIWATIGVVLANVLLILGLFVTGMQLPPHQAVGTVWIIALLLGPVPATAGGWLGGAAFGVYLATLRQRKQSA